MTNIAENLSIFAKWHSAQTLNNTRTLSTFRERYYASLQNDMIIISVYLINCFIVWIRIAAVNILSVSYFRRVSVTVVNYGDDISDMVLSNFETWIGQFLVYRQRYRPVIWFIFSTNTCKYNYCTYVEIQSKYEYSHLFKSTYYILEGD